MAERKLHEGRTPGTILADSSGAARKFGFHTSHGTPISSAPKLSDMWYTEWKGAHGQIMDDVSGLCRAVSPISVQTTTQPVDKYGKRVYVPTRVDFPEVTFTMYDTINGNTMMLAEGIYRRFFKNSNMNVDNGALETSLNEDGNTGRKLVSENDTFRSFERITLFHWFGNLETTGTIQRIILINPIVTNITFSGSEYGTSELRTIDFTVQPENIVFGAPYNVDPALPEWMDYGLEYILQSATVDSAQYVSSRLRANLNGNNQLRAFGDPAVDNRQFLSEDLMPGYEQLEAFPEQLTDEQYDARETKAVQQKIAELSKLHAELKAAEEARNEDARKDVLERLVQARNETGYIEARRAGRTNTSGSEFTGRENNGARTNTSGSEFTGRENNGARTNTSGSDFVAETLYPNLGKLQTSGGRPVGTEQFNSSTMGNLLSQELTSSFFNGRKFDIGNVTNGIAQGIMGNSGIGSLQNLGRTSQSRFGIGGDIVRDSLISSSRNNRHRTSNNSSNPPNPASSIRNTAQRGISALRNFTRGIRF